MFLRFVAHGQKNQAECLVSQCPELLLYEDQTTYSHRGYPAQRYNKGTVLQIALSHGAQGVDIYKNTKHFHAAYVIITVPLSVLKAGAIQLGLRVHKLFLHCRKQGHFSWHIHPLLCMFLGF